MVFKNFGIKSSQIFLLFIYTLIATLGMAKGGAWAAIAIAGGLITMLLLWREEKSFPMPDRRVFGFVLLFLAAAGGLSFFSLYQDEALYSSFKLATIFIPLSFWSAPAILRTGQHVMVEKRGLMLAVMSAGFIILISALLYTMMIHGFESMPMAKMNRSVSYGLMLGLAFLPAAFQISKKQGWALAGLMLACLALTHSRTTQAASLAGAVVFGLAWFWPVLTRRLVGFGMVVALGWPFYAQAAMSYAHDIVYKLPASLAHRVEIWDYVSYRIAEKPLLGWGVGVANKLDWAQPNGNIYKYTVGQAAHPHNAITQLWAEMGLWGLVLGIMACFSVLWALRRLSAAYMPYALACVVMGFVLLMAAYDLWTDSMWGAFALIGFTFAVLGRDQKARN